MNELVEAEMAEYRNGAYADHGSAKDQLTRFYKLAYAAGLEQGRADYEREHLRHTVALPDTLKAMQDQVAEACSKLCESIWDNQSRHKEAIDCEQAIRQGKWRKYMDGKP